MRFIGVPTVSFAIGIDQRQLARFHVGDCHRATSRVPRTFDLRFHEDTAARRRPRYPQRPLSTAVSSSQPNDGQPCESENERLLLGSNRVLVLAFLPAIIGSGCRIIAAVFRVLQPVSLGTVDVAFRCLLGGLSEADDAAEQPELQLFMTVFSQLARLGMKVFEVAGLVHLKMSLVLFWLEGCAWLRAIQLLVMVLCSPYGISRLPFRVRCYGLTGSLLALACIPTTASMLPIAAPNLLKIGSFTISLALCYHAVDTARKASRTSGAPPDPWHMLRQATCLLLLRCAVDVAMMCYDKAYVAPREKSIPLTLLRPLVVSGVSSCLAWGWIPDNLAYYVAAPVVVFFSFCKVLL